MTDVLTTRGLSVAYGGVHAVKHVDIAVRDGQCVGLIGPNGAGKTTFVDAITGFTGLAGGTVEFAAEDITTLGPDIRARRGLARTFQSLELFDDISVLENLLAVVDQDAPARWLADVLWPRRNKQAEARAVGVLSTLGMEWAVDRLPEDLSQGQRKLVSVARALAGNPKLIVLDEPAAGLSTSESVELADRLRVLPRQGMSVLLIDHDMGLVLGVCDYLYVMDFGEVIAAGTPAEIRTNPRVIEAYLGRQRQGRAS